MRLAFGGCVLDRERRELTRGGAAVHASNKLLAFLEILLDARPRALTKDEIHKSLWPDTFVSDGTLTSLVAELREALGDDARSPRLVRTIHGYGYAFCGDVSVAVEENRAGPCCRIILGDREVRMPPGIHVLGRSSEAAVFVDDVGVSRQHAKITVEGGRAVLEDLGSKNGTILNGTRIDAPAALADRDAIVLGATSLQFRIFSDAESTATVTGLQPDPR
jgi:DNA-binding winged helix-turn-helix (wHTH) protein